MRSYLRRLSSWMIITKTFQGVSSVANIDFKARTMSVADRPSDQRRSICGMHCIGAGAYLRARNSMAHAASSGIAGNYATSGGPTYCISYRANTSASILGPFGTAT